MKKLRINNRATNTQQNTQNDTSPINVTFHIMPTEGRPTKISILMEPETPITRLDGILRNRLCCQGHNAKFKYFYGTKELPATTIGSLKDISENDINLAIIVRDVPPDVIQNYYHAQQQNQPVNDTNQDQRQEEASQVNNINPQTPNLSVVPNGPYETSQTYSMVPQIPPPPQPIFAQDQMPTYKQPLFSLDNIAQAIRKQKNPKTRLRMKRKLATLKRIRAYLAKKRARSMFPNNSITQPFIRKKTRYTPRKKKKHMTTRKKVISRMEKNMRKRMKYKHKTRYKYKTKFKYKDLNAIRKYLIDEHDAQNNLNNGYGPGNGYGYNNY